MILGPSIEPEKPSPKSASTANPPQKVKIIGFFIKIYNLYHFIVHYPTSELSFSLLSIAFVLC
jgi:hypothetical protein